MNLEEQPMAVTDAPSRLMPLAEELLDNAYARENLREDAEISSGPNSDGGGTHGGDS